MTRILIELTLEHSGSVGSNGVPSFNNDSKTDSTRNSFFDAIPPFNPYFRNERKVPTDYLHPNVHYYDSDQICKIGNNIIVGEYCNEGVIVPRGFNITFNQLFNCTPLISLIKGDKEYLSFLHTWAGYDADVVDRQVKHWMKVVTKFGDISQTIFAPRKNGRGRDTEYKHAIDDITKMSKKTIVLTRNISEIVGIANTSGVYFRNCGYHLWEN